MLGLADEVAGDQVRVGVPIRDDENLGRAGEEIDAHASKERTFRFGDESVPGAHDEIGGMSREETEGERRHPLHSAERENGIRAAELRGVEDGGMHAALAPRRRAGDHVPHAGHLRGGDAHDRGGDVGVATAGHVAARRFHRNQALPGNEPRGELGLELPEALSLRLGESPHPLPGETDVVTSLGRQRCAGTRDHLRRHDDVALSNDPASRRSGVPRLRLPPRALRASLLLERGFPPPRSRGSGLPA